MQNSVKFKTKMFSQDNYAISLFVLQFVSNKEFQSFHTNFDIKEEKKDPSKRCETNKLITNYHNDVLREKISTFLMSEVRKRPKRLLIPEQPSVA